MYDSLEISTILPVSAKEIFEAWLDGEKHSQMTGGNAQIENKVDGKFTAWDGYIEGQTIELRPFSRIVQKWRTTEFPENSQDSHVEVILEELNNGTKITLRHSQIPHGQGKNYKNGWRDYYFEPMKDYFKIK